METLDTLTTEKIWEIVLRDENLKSRYNYKHKIKTKNKSIELSLGRIFVNSIFPDDYPLIDKQIGKEINTFYFTHFDELYDSEKSTEAKQKILFWISKLTTLYPQTFDIDDFVLPPAILKKRDKLISQIGKDGFDFEDGISELANEAFELLKKKNSGLYYLIKSGAKGNVDLYKILTIAKGSSVDIEGNITSNITQNQNDGYDMNTFVANANEARYTQYEKSLTVEEPGSLSRGIAYACNNVVIAEKDCKSKKYLNWTITEKNYNRIIGRYYLNTNKELELITQSNSESLLGGKINLRSPIYCKSKKGICEICYGKLFEVNNSKHIGMVSATVVNTLGINTSMKKRHKTSLATQEKSDFIKDLKDVI